MNGGHGSTVRWKNTEADASTRKKKKIYFFNWQRVTHTHRSTQTYLIKVSAVQRPLILLHQPCSTWFDRRCSLRRKTTQQRSCHADGVGAGLELHGHSNVVTTTVTRADLKERAYAICFLNMKTPLPELKHAVFKSTRGLKTTRQRQANRNAG